MPATETPFFFQELNYHLRTFGCQMNKHDSERLAGQLEALGAHAVETIEQADVVIFLTCCVREAADVRLLGQVASLKNLPPRSPDGRRIIAVGGCIGQRDGEKLVQQLPHIDIVFGTHNIAHFPALLNAALGQAPARPAPSPARPAHPAPARPAPATARPARPAQVEVVSDDQADALESSTYDLPLEREQAWHAWLPIMTGCNNYCSYCVVPYVRGRERSRPLDDVRREAEALVADGVLEITLLGQNVNSYGRDLYGQPRFAQALRAIGATGVKRLDFATSHPKDLSPATIAAFAEEPSVMPHLHLPVQSGSDSILKAMNRHYTAAHYRSLVADLRAACVAAGKGQIALSTDIIVGFPGETASDFEATYELVRETGFAQVFTFIYSQRAGTPAAALADDTPRELVQERFDRLVELVQQTAWEQNQPALGQVLNVLIDGPSKRDPRMLAGKSERNQTVHALLPDGAQAQNYAGRIVPVLVTEAKTWYLRGELA